jgi:hypothetical protein
MSKTDIIWMTVVIAVLAAIITPAAIAWNKKNENVENPVGDSNSTDNDWHVDGDVYIWTDEETGVQYLIYSDRHSESGMGGITPRLNADGTIYVVSDV